MPKSQPLHVTADRRAAHGAGAGVGLVAAVALFAVTAGVVGIALSQ